MNKNNLIIVGLLILVLAVGGYTLLNQNGAATDERTEEITSNTDAMAGKTEDNLNNSQTVAEVESPAAPESANEYVITSGNANYIVMKRFFSRPNEEVTGTSQEVEGTGWFDPESGQGYLNVNLDMATVKTNNNTRDSDVMKMFGDNTAISFVANISNTDIVMGEQFTAEVPGTLTVYGNQKDVVFNVTGEITEEGLTAQGTSEGHKISDFGLEPPSLINVFTVDDDIDFTFNITASRSN